ncbi:MAG TPA: nuclear transport factor 2 family protein [Urbifossiella sp.]|nr:nuclear transport factor 2 family protein [Urbifossiella sp.]
MACKALVCAACCATLVALASRLPAQPPEKQPTPAAREVEKAYRSYLDAAIRKDEKALLKVLAEDFSCTDGNGDVYKRADLFGILFSPNLKQESNTLKDVNVRVYGDAAIITARCTEKGTLRGIAFTNPLQCTLMLTKKDGEWLIVAEHVSKLR